MSLIWKGLYKCVCCKGGGSSSGAVDYPSYMKSIHADWLANTDISYSSPDTLTTSITTVMNNALSANPYTGAAAYNPTTQVTNFNTYVAQLLAADFSTMLADYKAELVNTDISTAVTAFATLLDNRVTSTTLPRFQRGMQDVNAVMSSAFVIGQALIEEGVNAEVANFQQTALLRGVFEGNTIATQQAQASFEAIKGASALMAEINRLIIVAKKEQTEQDLEVDVSTAKWNLEVFQHGANLLAAISGGTAQTTSKTNKVNSALGGALSGAASGALIGAQMGSVGGPWGAGIGAVVGLAAGLMF